MKVTLKTLAAAVLTVTLVACASSVVAPVNSLRGDSVATPDAAPDAKVYAGKRPGEFALISRTFKGQPPLIPHVIDDYDITPSSNDCLDCHISDDFKGKKMPMVAKSHLVANANPNAEPQLDMKRWQCNSCHVPQVDAKVLVENVFGK